jgi:hypothetical protein
MAQETQAEKEARLAREKAATEAAAGVSPETVAQLMALVKAQGEQINQLRQMQVEWKKQYDADMAQGIQLQTETYEDARARQEEEARRLALEISRETHAAANALRKKIRHRVSGPVADQVNLALVAHYRLGKSKAKAAEVQISKDNLKALVVNPLKPETAKAWVDIEKALDSQVVAGTAV